MNFEDISRENFFWNNSWFCSVEDNYLR